MKRIKVTPEEEELLLKFRWERRIWNAALDKAAESLRDRDFPGFKAAADQIELLRKDTF